jgi:hypothetical protein
MFLQSQSEKRLKKRLPAAQGARRLFKIIRNDFEQPQAGAEGASPKDGTSHAACTREYVSIASRRATPVYQAP